MTKGKGGTPFWCSLKKSKKWLILVCIIGTPNGFEISTDLLLHNQKLILAIHTIDFWCFSFIISSNQFQQSQIRISTFSKVNFSIFIFLFWKNTAFGMFIMKPRNFRLINTQQLSGIFSHWSQLYLSFATADINK